MAVEISQPFRVFTDVDGEPLEDGFIHIGAVNQNPQVVPISVFFDAALTIPAAQPIRTLGGYPSRTGTPSRLYVAEAEYSISVSNKNSTLIYSSLDSDNPLAETGSPSNGAALIARGDQIVNSITELRALLKTSSSKFAFVNGYYVAGDGGGGQYYLDAADTTSADNGGTIIVATDGGRWKLVSDGSVSVRQFGAKGDAVNNDTTAIQAALTAAKRITFGSAASTYKINGTLVISNGHLLDVGGASIIQDAIQTPMFNAASTDNVTIRGGRFVGKTEPTFTNTPSSLAICVTAANASDLSITDNRFENFYYSPLLVSVGGNRVEFSHNVVIGPGSAILGVDINFRNCIGVVVAGNHTRILGNDISATATGIIIAQGSTDVIVSANVLHDTINEHGMYVDTGVRGISITGNTVRNTGVAGTGIKVQYYDSFGITPDDVTIAGNSISHTGSDGILVINIDGTTIFAVGVAITGNTVFQAGQHGIDVRFVTGCVISGNSVDQSVQSGIYVSKANILDVIGNSIRITGSHGIFDDGTSNSVTYSNNLINTPGSNPANDCGLFIQDVNEHNIIGNVVRGLSTKTLNGLFISSATTGLETTEVRGNSMVGSNAVAMRFPVASGQLRYFGENVLKSVAGNDVGQSIPETLVRGTEENTYFGTAIPTTGTWQQGAKLYFRYPTAGGFLGAVCVVTGTPGTWKTFGPVTA